MPSQKGPAQMELQRAAHWATIGSFLVAVIMAVYMVMQPQNNLVQPAIGHATAAGAQIGASQPAATDDVGRRLMNWLPLDILVFAILVGGGFT